MARPKGSKNKTLIKENKKPLGNHVIIINEPDPEVSQPKPIVKTYIKDRLRLVASQNINFMGYISLVKDVPLVVAVDIFENLKNRLPSFKQMIENGIIRIEE
jgi:hypothetical protein